MTSPVIIAPPPSVNFKGVIFDLDGTLVDSLEDISDSMNSVLREHGFPLHGLREYRQFIGHGIRNLVSMALPREVEDEGLITMYQEMMVERYGNNCVKKTRPYDGITGLLDGLVERGIKLAVFSNKSDDLTKKVVAALLPDWRFEAVVGSAAGMPAKPDPSGALMISRQMGVSAGDMIYTGDSDVDMQTANKAGMCAVGALWGFRTKEELISNGAKYLLRHPMDMLRILQGRG